MTPERFANAAVKITEADDPIYVSLMLRVHLPMPHHQAAALRQIAQLEVERRATR